MRGNMKRTALVLAFVLLAAPVVADDFTISATTRQVNALTRAITKANTETCTSVGLAPNCVQGAARAAWIGAQNGAVCSRLALPGSCTETEARRQWCAMLGFPGVSTCTHPDGRGSAEIVFVTAAPHIEVFSSVANFLDRKAVKATLDEYVKRADEEDAAALAVAEAAIKSTGTKAEKDAYCAAIKKPAGCLP